jgi:hypothetical protein
MVTYAKVMMTMRDLGRLKIIQAVVDGDLQPIRVSGSTRTPSAGGWATRDRASLTCPNASEAPAGR